MAKQTEYNDQNSKYGKKQRPKVGPKLPMHEPFTPANIGKKVGKIYRGAYDAVTEGSGEMLKKTPIGQAVATGVGFGSGIMQGVRQPETDRNAGNRSPLTSYDAQTGKVSINGQPTTDDQITVVGNGGRQLSTSSLKGTGTAQATAAQNSFSDANSSYGRQRYPVNSQRNLQDVLNEQNLAIAAFQDLGKTRERIAGSGGLAAGNSRIGGIRAGASGTGVAPLTQTNEVPGSIYREGQPQFNTRQVGINDAQGQILGGQTNGSIERRVGAGDRFVGSGGRGYLDKPNALAKEMNRQAETSALGSKNAASALDIAKFQRQVGRDQTKDAQRMDDIYRTIEQDYYRAETPEQQEGIAREMLNKADPTNLNPYEKRFVGGILKQTFAAKANTFFDKLANDAGYENLAAVPPEKVMDLVGTEGSDIPFFAGPEAFVIGANGEEGADIDKSDLPASVWNLVSAYYSTKKQGS